MPKIDGDTAFSERGGEINLLEKSVLGVENVVLHKDGNTVYIDGDYIDTTDRDTVAILGRGSGADMISVSLGFATTMEGFTLIAYGGGGADRFYGIGERDRFFGEGGNDILNGGDGRDELAGGRGTDRLNGGAGRDVLSGGAGNDLLSGGASLDIIAGGGGRDTFILRENVPIHVEADWIEDFMPGVDRIHLWHEIFTALDTGGLSADEFLIGSAAKTADQHLIYNPDLGTISYDADGRGGDPARVIAVLQTRPQVTHADFFVFE